MDVHIRWMIRRDMQEVLAIETASFEFPWREEDFIKCLRQRNAIGMVAEHDDKVVGYVIYELHKNLLHILNFAVPAALRRQHIGAAMLFKITTKLSEQRRSRAILEVRETNVAAQLFFHSQGFRAVSILKDFYNDTAEDAYVMEYSVEAPKPVNRIAKYLAPGVE